MIIDFLIHNLYRKSVGRFNREDPHLSDFDKLILKHRHFWWKEMDFAEPGIFLLFGGRQTGKTTSLKLLIKHLLKEIPASNIAYLACDLIRNRFELIDNIRFHLKDVKSEHPLWLFLDEITFVAEWEVSIKALADEGVFRKNFCVITGSDQILLQQARRGLVGRRGNAERVDFAMHTLSFREFHDLVKTKNYEKRDGELFKDFIICGGYLKAINDFYSGAVKKATIKTYADWLIGDFERQRKSIRTLIEILKSLVVCYSSQITFGSLLDHVQNISKPTLIEYIDILERMGVIFILYAYDQNKKTGALKKARKIYFADPFLFSVVSYLLGEHQGTDKVSTYESNIVEGIVISEFRRRYPSFYLKGKGEIDLVYLKNKKPEYVEIKWGKQLRANDLKEIKKYKSARILATEDNVPTVNNIPVKSVVVELLSHNLTGYQP